MADLREDEQQREASEMIEETPSEEEIREAPEHLRILRINYFDTIFMHNFVQLFCGTTDAHCFIDIRQNLCILP